MESEWNWDRMNWGCIQSCRLCNGFECYGQLLNATITNGNGQLLKSFMLGCHMMSPMFISSKHFGCNVDDVLAVWQEWMCTDQ